MILLTVAEPTSGVTISNVVVARKYASSAMIMSGDRTSYLLDAGKNSHMVDIISVPMVIAANSTGDTPLPMATEDINAAKKPMIE